MEYINNMVGSLRSRRSKTGRSKAYKKSSTRTTSKRRTNCSPYSKKKAHATNSCYTEDSLQEIKNDYNKSHPGSPIKASNTNGIRNELIMRLKYCNNEDEKCILKGVSDAKLQQKLNKLLFAPDSPAEWKKNPNEWLSNYDIMSVLEQYEATYPNFKFISPSPIDFDSPSDNNANTCITEEICKFSLQKQLDNNITKIGMIFNLDKHNQSGSHWVSLFIDLENKFIFYFDSTGNKIPPEIKTLKNRIVTEAAQLKPKPMTLKYLNNYKTVHQHGNTECGMYSLFFIITLLTNATEYDKNMTMNDKIMLFTKKHIDDKYVEKYRTVYFSN